MKKIFSSIAIFLCIVILAGCGIVDQPPKDDGTLPDNPVINDPSENPEEKPNPDDKKDDVKKATYLSRATELVDNLENVPDSGELFSSGVNAKNISVLNSDGTGDNITDLTTPDKNFYNDPSWYHWIVPTQALNYDFLDGTIRFISEDIRSRVLENVVQLDTWVQLYSDSVNKTHARLKYDVNSDTATLEYLEYSKNSIEYNVSYYKILSSYTAEGKTVVRATVEKFEKYDHHTITAHGKYSLNYVEDGEYYFSCLEPMYSTFGDKDENGNLITNEPTQAWLLVVEKDMSDPSSEVIIKAVQATYPELACEFVDRREFLYHDDDYRYTYNRGLYVTTLDGKPVCEMNEYQLFVNLYHVDGWEKCYVEDVNPEQHETKTYVEIGGTKYENLNTMFFYVRNESLLDTVSARIPYLVFNLNFQQHPDQDAFYAESVSEINKTMEKYGLSFKNIDLEDIYSRYKQYKAANDATTADEILETLSQMKLFDDMTEEEMTEMFEEEFVTAAEQVENDDPYGIAEAVLTGSVVRSQDNALDFSEITVTVKKNALLLKDAKYSLVLCLKSEFVTVCETVSKFTFDGSGDISMTFERTKDMFGESDDMFEEEFKFDFEQLSVGDYAMQVFVANEKGLRISGYLDLPSQESFEIITPEYKIVSENGLLTVCRLEPENGTEDGDENEKLPEQEPDRENENVSDSDNSPNVKD